MSKKLGKILVLAIPAGLDKPAEALIEAVTRDHEENGGEFPAPECKICAMAKTTRLVDLDSELEAVNTYLTKQFIGDPDDMPEDECRSEARWLLGSLVGRS